MGKFKSQISRHLDIIVTENEDELDGEKMQWKEILVHGDSDGLKSLANLLIKLADLNQENVAELPLGAREHIHLRPKFELANSSEKVIVGRLDNKETGAFYPNYFSKDNSK